VREVEGLAHGFFRGPESFRAEIFRGNLSVPLRQIREATVYPYVGSGSESEPGARPPNGRMFCVGWGP